MVNRTIAPLVVGAAIIFLSLVAHLSFDAARRAAPWANNDSALILFIAQEMDAGARLYVDWYDLALPSLFFIGLTAVRLAHAGIPVVLAYDFIVVATAIAGLLVLVRSLRALDRPWPALILAAAGYLLFVVRSDSITRDFGHGEHIFALLLVPELFAIVSPARMPWRPVWCAALAFAAMIKPQFAAIVILLELTAPRQMRPLPADTIGFLAGAIAPFGMLWLHSAESFRALFTETVALHVSGAYALLNDESAAALLARGPMIVAGVATAAAATMALATRENRRLRGLATRGAVALVWGAVAVVQQQKYFPYHFTPLFGLALVTGAWAAGETLARRRLGPIAGIAAVVAVLGGGAAFHIDVAANGDPLPVRLGQVVGPEARLLVIAVHSHGLCTPYRGAPRCIGPEARTIRLPQMARATDSADRIGRWAAAVAARIREERPEILAIAPWDSTMPSGMSFARLVLEEFPILRPGEYVSLSPDADAFVQDRRGGWVLLRRHDVSERLAGRTIR